MGKVGGLSGRLRTSPFYKPHEKDVAKQNNYCG